jgi:hypothetical protein
MEQKYKYPRTFHLPWSQSVHSDDKVISSLSGFEGEQVVVTEKMDGENTTLYSDGMHARSLDSQGGEDRAWVKSLQAEIGWRIPQGLRICGENVWAQHSIAYSNLKSYFYGFGVWKGRICLSWKETVFILGELNIPHPAVLFHGLWDEETIKRLSRGLDFSKVEGYVVRTADPFTLDKSSLKMAKFVRKNHVQTDKHWRHQALKKNLLST